MEELISSEASDYDTDARLSPAKKKKRKTYKQSITTLGINLDMYTELYVTAVTYMYSIYTRYITIYILYRVQCREVKYESRVQHIIKCQRS